MKIKKYNKAILSVDRKTKINEKKIINSLAKYLLINLLFKKIVKAMHMGSILDM